MEMFGNHLNEKEDTKVQDHLFSALATANCDYMVKEATGLLMKECDELRHIQQHQNHVLEDKITNNPSKLKCCDHVSIQENAGSVYDHNDAHDSANDHDDTVAQIQQSSPTKTSHSKRRNVATALLRVVKARIRNRDSKEHTSSSDDGHKGGEQTANKVHYPIVEPISHRTAATSAPNGHARGSSPPVVGIAGVPRGQYNRQQPDNRRSPSPPSLVQNNTCRQQFDHNHTASTAFRSSPSPQRSIGGIQLRATRSRNKFPIDFQKFNSGLRRRANTPPAESSSTVTANRIPIANHRPASLAEERPTPSLTKTVHSASSLDDERHEHQLIALKSALLDAPESTTTQAHRNSNNSQSTVQHHNYPSTFVTHTGRHFIGNRVNAMIHEETSLCENHSTAETSAGGGDSTCSGNGTGVSSRDEISLPDGIIPSAYFFTSNSHDDHREEQLYGHPDDHNRPSTSSDDQGAVSPPKNEPFLHSKNRCCTSYRLEVPQMKNPVDICALPGRTLAVADYDNGFLVVDGSGDILKHAVISEGKSACGVCLQLGEDGNRLLLVLAYKDGFWSIHSFTIDTFDPVDAIECPNDPQVESWAIRKLAVGGDGQLYLLATGEHRTVIWSIDQGSREWKTLVTENSRRGIYNDFAARYDAARKEMHFLLCDYRKAQLSTVIVTESEELAGIQSIRMRRVKGQEWIVQGPKLAVWDDEQDIVLYDGSGKLFWFDGGKFKFRKIIGDVGKGEVGAIATSHGWCYALCRYKLCIEAFLYKEYKRADQSPETTL